MVAGAIPLIVKKLVNTAPHELFRERAVYFLRVCGLHSLHTLPVGLPCISNLHHCLYSCYSIVVVLKKVIALSLQVCSSHQVVGSLDVKLVASGAAPVLVEMLRTGCEGEEAAQTIANIVLDGSNSVALLEAGASSALLAVCSAGAYEASNYGSDYMRDAKQNAVLALLRLTDLVESISMVVNDGGISVLLEVLAVESLEFTDQLAALYAVQALKNIVCANNTSYVQEVVAAGGLYALESLIARSEDDLKEWAIGVLRYVELESKKANMTNDSSCQ